MKKIFGIVLITTACLITGCGAKGDKEVEEKPKVESKEINLEKTIEKAYGVILENNKMISELEGNRDNINDKISKDVGGNYPQEYTRITGKYGDYENLKKDALKIFDSEESFKNAYSDLIIVKDGKVYGADMQMKFIHTFFGPLNGEVLDDKRFILEIAGEHGAGNEYTDDKRYYWAAKYQFKSVEDLRLTAKDKKYMIFEEEERCINDELEKLLKERKTLEKEEFNLRKNNLIRICSKYTESSVAIDSLIKRLNGNPSEETLALEGEYFKKDGTAVSSLLVSAIDKDKISIGYDYNDPNDKSGTWKIRAVKSGDFTKKGDIWVGTLVSQAMNREIDVEVKFEKDKVYYRETYLRDFSNGDEHEIDSKFEEFKK